MARRSAVPLLLLALTLISWLSPCSAVDQPRDVLYQTSTIDALLAGIYDGTVTFQELSAHGDFGLGTFSALDGEMIAVDGVFYQIRADGIARPVPDTMTTPFAAVTFFDRDLHASIQQALDFPSLTALLDSLLPSKNLFYAIRIEGEFAHVKTRSVPKQQKPYPKLVDVVAEQPTFDLRQVSGTMVGLRCPAYVEGINVPGYHFHFLDKARSRGGHVLDCRVQQAVIWVDITPDFQLSLPESGDFLTLQPAQDPHQVQAVEQQHNNP